MIRFNLRKYPTLSTLEILGNYSRHFLIRINVTKKIEIYSINFFRIKYFYMLKKNAKYFIKWLKKAKYFMKWLKKGQILYKMAQKRPNTL